jgi:hypothetical protein
MPDPKDNELADKEQTPDTPLHAYKEGRDEDVEGDPHPEVGEEGDKDEGVGNPVGEKERDGGDASDAGEKGLGSESGASGGEESPPGNADPSTKGATKGTEEAL